ncbi:MAG: EamA family transporter [Alphaproteobacteria bacterium]|nr:EamA family transporter [Alphaproteobacteria bacterium]MBV9370076.1 EamA family transporter [Alphaproteobacteria bacterium]MBV9900750.1 EamA family transporter [Alphaproteobacteria bacterium]
MSLAVFLAVLGAAMLHAGWNAVVKLGVDRFSSVLLLALVQGGLALLLAPLFPAPAPAAWPWVVAGSCLHTGYKLFLIRAYGQGDLSQVYPLARGTAPLIVTVAGALFLGEAPTPVRAAAVLAIAGGIMLMAGKGGLSRAALAWALGTAGFTAAYTMADGVGARLAGSASGFAMWMFALDGLLMLAVALATRGRAAVAALAPAWRGGASAGAMSLGSYWIAIWAFTQAPLAMVAALRETSVLFALLIAFFLLKERVAPRRWAAGALILAGIVLMRA